jgi:DNA polymerase
VLCVGYCVDDGEVQIWRPGDPVPKPFKEAARSKQWTAVAHNAPFEMAIERYVLPRYGFPVIPIERNVCTMAIAQACALPAALGHLATALNLKHQKDVAGQRLMLQLARPRRLRKGDNPDIVQWFEDDERLLRLYDYCRQDVATAREIVQRLPRLSENEYKIWLLDQKINSIGLYIDADLAKAARKVVEEAGPFIDAKLTHLTEGQVTTIHQVAKLTAWVAQHHPCASIGKKAAEELLEDEALPAPAREALQLRLDGAQAATKKINPLLDRRDSDGRLRGAFVYHAASTGRWASRGAQLQNLKRPNTEDIERAIKVIGRGSFNYARKYYPNPLSVIGDLIRAMICAAPGHVLIGADFSGIEARVTAWLAGETRKLDVFREYDCGEGPDPYIIAAADINGVDARELAADFKAGKPVAREMRQQGKAAELSFGFAGTVGAYRKFAPDTTLTDAEIRKINVAWRHAHPSIERIWSSLFYAARKAISNSDKEYTLGTCSVKLSFEYPFLWMTLPSGRRLAYPFARLVEAFITYDTKQLVLVDRPCPGSSEMLVFKDASSGRWHDIRVWEGILIENLVQAVARDLLAAAMQRVDAAGMKIVGHIHDEAIIEVPEQQAEFMQKRFTRLMQQTPLWAKGLPIRVSSWTAKRYVK